MRRLSRGFTLVEMLVVIALIGIISAVVLSSQQSFNKNLLLVNTISDIALSVRSAQTLGIGSRTRGGLSTPGYGVELKTNNPTYFLFVDDAPTAAQNAAALGVPITPATKPGDGKYASTGSYIDSPPIQTLTMNNGILITSICIYGPGVTGGITPCDITRLDAVFTRPNIDAIMTAYSANTTYTNLTSVCITVRNPSGTFRNMYITLPGSVYTVTSVCPT